MKEIARKLLSKFGYSVGRIPVNDGSTNPFSDVTVSPKKIVDVDKLANISLNIPGMINPESGKFLYALCLTQDLHGDVVEVGSWQGRSTSFLARATRDSGNGEFYAIDHFQGNVGRESYYTVGKPDLSDLKDNFENNMRKIDLWESIHLLDMPNDQAAKKLTGVIRFLFIDGDHTKSGVEKDITLFFPFLKPGSLVVFDDFQKGFPGLVEAVEGLFQEREFSRVFSYRNTLVLKV